MNLKRHQLMTDLIDILMQFMLIYLLITIALRSFLDHAAVKALFLLPAPFLSYAIRVYTKHIWSFLALHTAMFLLYILIADHPLLMAVYGIYLAALTIYAYYQKHQIDRQSSISPYTVLAFLLPYLGSYFLHMPDLQRLSFFLAVAYTLLNVLNRYLINLTRFAKNHADIQNIPFQQIKSSNHVLVMFLCSLFFITMLVFSYLPLGTIASYLGRLILRAIRFLFSFIHLSEPEVPEETAPAEAAPAAYDIPPAEPSRLMQLISEIFQWVATILLIAAVVTVILYAVYRLYRYFYLKSEGLIKDEVTFLSPYSKKSPVKRASKHTHRWFFGHSNNEVIRRSYAKAVAANTRRDAKLLKSLTPSQLSDYALGRTEAVPSFADSGNTSQKLTAHYEKARYSNEECTKEEVRRVKEILR